MRQFKPNAMKIVELHFQEKLAIFLTIILKILLAHLMKYITINNFTIQSLHDESNSQVEQKHYNLNIDIYDVKTFINIIFTCYMQK